MLFFHEGIGERLNVQPAASGNAKAYQIRQLLRLAEQYDLKAKGR